MVSLRDLPDEYKKRFEEAYGTEKELLKQVDDILDKRQDEFFDNMPF